MAVKIQVKNVIQNVSKVKLFAKLVLLRNIYYTIQSKRDYLCLT